MNKKREFEEFLNKIFEEIPRDKKQAFLEEYNRLSKEYDEKFNETPPEKYEEFFFSFLDDLFEIYYKYSRGSQN
jgi:hypothetical protein